MIGWWRHQKMVLALTSAHKVIGVIVTIGHFLMYVFSTQMLPPIGKCSYHQHTAFTNAKSRGLMTNVYGK
ncbi:hypothetical protein EMCRGX_G034007 [Ephydatia muelleri]